MWTWGNCSSNQINCFLEKKKKNQKLFKNFLNLATRIHSGQPNTRKLHRTSKAKAERAPEKELYPTPWGETASVKITELCAEAAVRLFSGKISFCFTVDAHQGVSPYIFCSAVEKKISLYFFSISQQQCGDLRMGSRRFPPSVSCVPADRAPVGHIPKHVRSPSCLKRHLGYIEFLGRLKLLICSWAEEAKPNVCLHV